MTTTFDPQSILPKTALVTRILTSVRSEEIARGFDAGTALVSAYERHYDHEPRVVGVVREFRPYSGGDGKPHLNFTLFAGVYPDEMYAPLDEHQLKGAAQFLDRLEQCGYHKREQADTNLIVCVRTE